ncbi:Ribokinase-like protein [Tribonema minus]|uniref:Ribokinase-like protein n=1 Tax=Tribonema minus TaxID=303371 RepID=A0A836C9H7_9STRA|nr:Ribokinase-like protein [Tribonema minus]
MNIDIIGDVFVDVIAGPIYNLPSWGGDTLVQKPIKLMLGGSGGNMAAHTTGAIGQNLLQGRAVRCRLHSAVAADELGQFARQQLQARGITLKEKLGGARGAQGACLVISGLQDRCFITHRGNTATFRQSDLCQECLADSSHVHIAGYYNMDAFRDDVPELFERMRRLGATTSLTPQYDADEKWRGMEALYPHTTLLLLNELEAQKLSGLEGIDPAARFFMQVGHRNLIFLQTRNASIRSLHQPSKVVKVVDTTGAGDAFAGGFVYAWKVTGSVEEALRWGCAYGAATVQRVGGSDVTPLSRADLEACLL